MTAPRQSHPEAHDGKAARRGGHGPMPLLTVAAMLVIGIAMWFGGFERSAWILMTAPDADPEGFASNTFWGYSGLIGDRPLHRENLHFFVHALFFSGGEVPRDFYVLRPVYTFLTSALTPLVGWLPSMLAVNVAAWIAGICLAYLFTLRVTKRRPAAFWACLLSIGGMGFVAHVHDYSAHLLAFTSYFAAAYLVYVSDVWRLRREWRVHAAAGAFLALTALQYNTGIAATAGYALASVRHNGILRPLLVCGGVYCCTALWPHALNALSGMNIDYGEIERAYLLAAINTWKWLSQHPLQLAWTFLTTVFSYAFYEMPLLVVTGLVGVVVLVREKADIDFTIFVLALFVAPILAISVYAGPSVAKGYITFQTAIFVYLGAGYLLDRFATHRRGGRVAMIAGGSLVAVQLAWNLSYLVGLIGPIRLYFIGMSDLLAWLPSIAIVPKIVSMTGADPVPTLFRGDATVLDAGAITCAGLVPLPDPEAKLLRAVIVRGPFALLCAAAAYLLLRTQLLQFRFIPARPQSSALASAVLAVILVFPAASLNLPLRAAEFPRLCGVPGTTGKVVSAREFRYEVDLDPAFVVELEAVTEGQSKVELIHGFRYAKLGSPDTQVSLAAGEERFELRAASEGNNFHRVDRSALIRGLRLTPRLVLEASSPAAPLPVEGWQRNGLPGRRLFAEGRLLRPHEQEVLPLLEIRARRLDGIHLLKLGAF